MASSASLGTTPIDPQRELSGFLAGLDGQGGVVTFVGIARPRDSEGLPVLRMLLEHHPRLTQRSLDEIAGEASARFAPVAIRVVHRCGEIGPGEPIVFVAAASDHRRAAFECADYLMDRLKTDAVFWKREDGEDGSRWIEPSDADRAARARWSK